MGNQNSKGTGDGLSASASQTSLDKGTKDFQSYPSFSKADTKESTRSFRGALKSKIPGTKTDSPRASTSGLPIGESSADKSDAASVKSGRNSRSALTRSAPADGVDSPTSPTQDSTDNVTPALEDSKPPPPQFNQPQCDQDTMMLMQHNEVARSTMFLTNRLLELRTLMRICSELEPRSS
ncbi:hypothetical protein D0Z07_8536 [Hyphodiscus hymeniophilus]|uniref:Uncharacterized protein n=1 Tax=Hyphodiscus hymeniophilus TaxID=353542 RepID=A0A9P6SQQ9_9HELO|nr:hypothetical protein D0Z07_8536 [Hyphodiscus hymeniophilus]